MPLIAGQIREWRQLFAQLDDVTIFVLPVVQKGEIVAYGLNACHDGTDIGQLQTANKRL
jgi:hypothetical protein